MAPASSFADNSSHLVVAWDLDTTGRRLIDEICQVGGYYVLGNGSTGSEASVFSQYVMPYKNPNPGARRSFGIRVVNVGRYRMLKDMNTGKILKTKSEVSALQDFIAWLEEGRKKANKDGVLLACHEMNRKVLVPLLLEGVHKYNLQETFEATVKGFVNGVDVCESLGSKETITSHSLRSLCKTVLGDTNPDTNSASDRSKVLVQILAKICSNTEGGDKPSGVGSIDASKLMHVVTSVEEEASKLKHLKGMLDTQGTLRPIFEHQLKQKRAVRDRALVLRRLVAESGLDYKAVESVYEKAKAASSEDSSEEKLDEELKSELKSKVCEEASDEDVDELAALFKEHFSKKPTEQSDLKSSTTSSHSPKRFQQHNYYRKQNQQKRPSKAKQEKDSTATASAEAHE